MHDTDYATTWLPDPTGAAVLRLGGELDINARDPLAEDLLAAIRERRYPGITVDLTDVAFIDSEALSSLLLAYSAARDAGIAYRLTGATGVVQRVLKVAGVLDLAHPPAG
ncbi:STAS domain-containing protein [Actinoplanes awajinensis]|uniref:Anti-sigma factor antagonist n=1 Tax=Actinoplanes awajinensis subsp. mycoplanecinus TaxID=135947 RepID=A0A0X3V4A1_9ACTN|nr:STAS domain-containing protein [Actinoplanes awajinensis]KUL39601.1 hypothetical protein ADL15_09040 [Actinoplanes awajinensis subsp. mycoplanecinus]